MAVRRSTCAVTLVVVALYVWQNVSVGAGLPPVDEPVEEAAPVEEDEAPVDAAPVDWDDVAAAGDEVEAAAEEEDEATGAEEEEATGEEVAAEMEEEEPAEEEEAAVAIASRTASTTASRKKRDIVGEWERGEKRKEKWWSDVSGASVI